MKTKDLIKLRLANQQISNTQFSLPEEIVSWMGAMQAQEFAHVKWAVGLRLRGVYEADVERAFNNGSILRTHLLRPTWHFVSPGDIRWMLTLTAPRVHTANSYMYKQLELDSSLFKKSSKVIVKALEGGNELTRSEIKDQLSKAKIRAEGLRLGYVLMHAELEGIICSGPRKGRQFTYMLLAERVPHEQAVSGGASELVRRFFTSRGPASIKDFVYWSGLTVKEARAGIEDVRSKFLCENIDGEEHFFSDNQITGKKNGQRTFLMPEYDEYGMSYKNRSFLRTNAEMNLDVWPFHIIIAEGQFGGKWKAQSKGNTTTVSAELSSRLKKSKEPEVRKAIERYKSFIGN